MDNFGDILELEDVFRHVKRRADLMEIRFEETFGSEIVLVDGNPETVKNINIGGGNVSSFVGHGKGFVCFTNFNNITKYCKQAVKQASLMDLKLRKLLNNSYQLDTDMPVINDTTKLATDENPLDVSLEEKTALMKEYANLLLNCSRVKSSTVDYTDMIIHKHYFNSEGSIIEQEIVRACITAQAVARKGSIVEQAWTVNASTQGFKRFRRLHDDISNTAQRAVNLLDAKTMKTMNCPVILGPAFTGILVHEAFGHLFEADNIIQSKSLQHKMKLGTVMENENLTIIDEPVRGKDGYYRYDDEGIPSSKTFLVKEGKLVGRLHSRETASQMNEKFTGNARAVGFNFPPIVRMSCTYMDISDWGLEDLIESIKEGVYLTLPRAGMTDMKGQFVLGSQESLRVEKGEAKSMLRNVSITGNVFSVLTNIEAIGNDLKLVDASCTKNEQAGLPVSYGGPHIKVNNMLVTGA